MLNVTDIDCPLGARQGKCQWQAKRYVTGWVDRWHVINAIFVSGKWSTKTNQKTRHVASTAMMTFIFWLHLGHIWVSINARVGLATKCQNNNNCCCHREKTAQQSLTSMCCCLFIILCRGQYWVQSRRIKQRAFFIIIVRLLSPQRTQRKKTDPQAVWHLGI